MLPVSMLGGVFAMIVAAAILTTQGAPILVSPRDMGTAVLIGAVILALGMVAYTLGSRVIPAAELVLLSLIEVLLAPVWVFLFLGETASAGTFIGGGVLLAAVVLNAVMGARRPDATGVAETP
jgi:DME family drug/metabolite transporter